MKLPIIIGEIGVNANGSIPLVKELMMMAASCGIPYVKFQKRDIATSAPPALRDVLRPSIWNDGEMITNLEHRRRSEYTTLDYLNISSFAKELPIGWFTSVWDIPSLAFMAQFPVPYIKIPSALITNLELLRLAATYTKNWNCQLIISSGMSSLEEVDTAIDVVGRAGVLCPILFHCHSGYPADDSELNLSLIPFYKERYGGLIPIGFSSHSTSPFPAIYAAAWGAEYIEVHITLDRTMKGSDQAASLEKSGLELLVREVNRLKDVWGTPHKIIHPSELVARKRLRGY